MDPILRTALSSFSLGREARHKNMSVFPIASLADGDLDLLTLKEALERNVFMVTEISEGGSVPNLKVANKGDLPVLLLDGEELAGAKQNRVLNAAILVPAKSELVIPVSCTEAGRWSYVSRDFEDSGHVMASRMRSMHNAAVASSLRASGVYRSDQGAVWNSIHEFAAAAGAHSETGAMRDVFEARKSELDEYLKAFECEAHQRGLLVMIGGQVMGFDFVSREKAFSVLFPKLVKSYAIEAWLQDRHGNAKRGAGGAEAPASGDSGTSPSPADENLRAAQAFLVAAGEGKHTFHDSPGLGRDVRFDAPGLVGSALVADEKVIHMALFGAADSERAGSMAGTSRRRSFRL